MSIEGREELMKDKVSLDSPNDYKEERFWTLEMDEKNKDDCLKWLHRNKMEAIVDEEVGGIIAYIHREHIGKIIPILNKRGELNGL